MPSNNRVAGRVVVAVGFCAALAGFTLGRFTGPAREDASSSAKLENVAASPHSAKMERDRRTNLGEVRLDQLGHVPLDEVRELLTNRDATELAETARKFDRFPPNPLTYSNLRPFFRTWAQMDEIAALKSALLFKDSRISGIAIEEIAKSVSPEAAGRLVPILRQQTESSLPSSVRNELLAVAVTTWSQSNPAEAAKILIDEPELRKTSGLDVLRNWGWIEGSTALAWLNSNPSANSYDAGAEFSAMMKGWVEKDPVASSSYVTTHLDDPRALESIHETAFDLFFVDKELSLRWVEQLPAGEVRARAKAEIGKFYAMETPAEAAEWAARSYTADGGEAFSAAINGWASRDPDAALVWINTQSGALRDSALTTYCIDSNYIRPAKAISAALTMTNAEARDSTVRTLLEHWLESSSEEAIAWIRSSNLPPRQKETLLKRAADRTSP